jgi:hypothetical protein
VAVEAVQAPPPLPVGAAPPRRPRADDDYYDEPPPRRGERGYPPQYAAGEGGTGLQLGMGIAGLSAGIIGLIITAVIPCIGWYAGLPIAGIGLLLGLVGVCVAISQKWRGIAFPAAGSAVSLVGVIVGFISMIWFHRAVRDVTDLAHAAQDLAGKMAKQGPFDKRDMIVSSNNLKQLGLAMHIFHDAHRRFPHAASDGRFGKGRLSWRVALLPYIEQDQLYKQFKLGEPWDSPHNIKLLDRMPEIYRPVRGNAQPNTTFYQLFTGPEAIFREPEPLNLTQIRDGTSNTILIVEAGRAVPWTAPEDIPYSSKGPLPQLGGMFGGDFHVAMADGDVHFMRRANYGDDILRRLINPNDGMVIPSWPPPR